MSGDTQDLMLAIDWESMSYEDIIPLAMRYLEMSRSEAEDFAALVTGRSQGDLVEEL